MTPPHGVEATPCAALKPETLYSSVGGLDLPQYRMVVTHDMNGHFVKTDSVVEFLDAFLPYPSTAPKRRMRQTNPFESLVNADKLVEADVVALFTKAVKSKNLCPNMVLVTSQHTPDPKGVDKTQQKVDAAFFHTKDAPRNGRPGWPLDVVPAEFKNRKYGDIYDPLNDKAKDSEFESQADTRTEVRGQLTTYSELIHELQHRIFLIMLLIIGRRYRLMRWDRAGTIVTPSIDYYTNPDDLCEFLWRISHLDDEALGIDPTAIRLKGDAFDELDIIAQPVSSDVDHTPRVLKEHELSGKFCFRYVRQMFAMSIQNRALPRYKLHIRMDDALHTFLVGKPVAVTHGMVGRGTRGWVAWYCEGGYFVWLKDAWRVSFEAIEREGDILGRLNHAKTPCVPTLICHGDIGGQTTLTADWWKRKNGSTTPPTVPTLPQVPVPGDDGNNRKSKRPRLEQHNDSSSHDSQPVTQPHPRRAPLRACRGVEQPVVAPEVRRRKKPTASAGPAEPILLNNPSMGPAVYTHDCHIRHHTHYRMVVKEVGMPLKEFLNGRQLASILLDCIVAHNHAATSRSMEVHILHRDVSDKNIIIYPKLTRSSSKNGIRSLAWGGILTDWEISKPIPKFDAKQKARQPERTGRWQFMSAKLLMNPHQRVMIEDELESFFHILVYYAVRYLKSTLVTDDDAAYFLEACFDCFTVHGNKVICGAQKLLLVTGNDGGSSEILFIHPMYIKRPITFGSKALDGLIATMIRCLRARYKILAWNEWINNLSEDHPSHPHYSGRYKTPPPPSHSDAKANCITSGSADTVKSDTEQYGEPHPVAPSPTKDDRDDAMLIAGYKSIRQWFQSALQDGVWKDNDRLGDRVPSNYNCHFPLVSSLQKTSKSKMLLASGAGMASS